MTDKFIFDAKQKLSRNESIIKAIDFGIERKIKLFKKIPDIISFYRFTGDIYRFTGKIFDSF